MINVGVVGNGYVGKATALMAKGHNVKFHDNDESKSDCSLSELAYSSDLIFICVPTPMDEDGSCCTDIVRTVAGNLRISGVGSDKVVIRSTVPMGTCNEFESNFMPEFLTEKNWEQDVINCKEWVFGVHDKKNFNKSLIEELVGGAKIHYCTTQEAELCKYVRNCFLATKVSFFNEIYEFCEKSNLDYEKVKHLTLLDERINSSHTQVPGPDGRKGFGGTCFPKDMSSLNHQMVEKEILSYIIASAISRNKNTDRPEQDWKKDKGRAVS
tara:strand:- start:2982 stop:3788 length:807 start_codon:yes stop_codon:yes gene_type:complete